MKKKLYILGLVVVMSALWAGCGDKGSNSEAHSSTAQTVTQVPTPVVTAQPSIEVLPTETPTPTLDPSLLVLPPEEKVPDLTDVWNDYNEKPAIIEGIIRRESEARENPCINISTINRAEIKSKTEYVGAIIDVFNCEEQYRLTAGGGIKVRGNSTAESDPKPYRIKFETKQNILGLHNGEAFKSWVLLKPMWNCCPDYLAHSVYNAMVGGRYFGSDDLFVNLYIDGKYVGLYLLCEQTQATEGRIEVHEPKKEDTNTDIGYFVELDNYPGDDHPYFTMDYNKGELTDMLGVTREIPADDYSVKSDIYTVEQLAYIEKYFKGVYEIVYNACVNNEAYTFEEDFKVVKAEGMSAEEAVSAVVDVDSVVYMLLLDELAQNYDVGAGSFNFAVDFSENSKYEKLTFLAPWDYNWAFYENANKNYYASTWQKLMDNYDRSNIWFMVFMKADWFRQRVIDKLKELVDNNTIEDELKNVSNYIEGLRNDYGDLAWQVDKGNELVDFIRKRIKFLTNNLELVE